MGELKDPKEISPRERLRSLEQEGKYFFHGSPDFNDVLEPRQPFSEGKKHGEPSVAASPFADIAIFSAIINPKNFPGEPHLSEFGVKDNGELDFKTTKDVLAKATAENKKGFVYVLSRAGFEPFSDMESRSTGVVKPEEVLEVSAQDLPENITLIEIK